MKRIHDDGYTSDIDNIDIDNIVINDQQNYNNLSFKKNKTSKLASRLGYKYGVTNKIRDGLIDPSPLTINCIPINGSIDWVCNSSSSHHIRMGIENGKIIFECHCGHTGTNNRYCKHINSIVLKICLDYIEDASIFNIEKEDNKIIKMSINNIISSMSSISIN